MNTLVIRLVRAPLAAVLAFVEEWQPATTPRRTMQDALNDYESEHETLPESEPVTTSAGEKVYLDSTAEWIFTAGEMALLGLKPGDILGNAVVGPPKTSTVPPTVDPSRPNAVAGTSAEGVEAPTPPSALPTFVDWAVPAICDVLADHRVDYDGEFFNCFTGNDLHASCPSLYDWREHVAPAISARLEAAGAQHTPK